MSTTLRRTLGIAVTGAALLASATRVSAQESGFTWENAAELSFVGTGGNASSSTLGLKAALTAADDVNTFKLELGGVRGETGFRELTATGTPASFTVTETTRSELTAESYFARARAERAFGVAYGFGGAGWDRNTFAGVQNRYAFVTGVGRDWATGEDTRFKTDLGLTYTIQKDVDPAPDADEGFGGIRLSVDAERPLSETTTFASVLVLDENLEDTEDLRADWTNSLSVSLSGRLALKTSLQLLMDNQPSLLALPLLDGGGAPSGTTVLTPADKVDSVFTLTLVITL